MPHVAETYVYRMADGSGYVGRNPQGAGQIIARRGDTIDDETMAALGLEDLVDHSDYKAANAANVTAAREDGSIGLKVKGKWVGESEAAE